MEMGDDFRSGSLRVSSSNFWKGGEDVFTRSIREEDDEDALKWAALEKLPTYSRVRTGMLKLGEGEHKAVDVSALGPQEKKNLLDRLVRVAEEDNESFLLKLKDRIDRSELVTLFSFAVFVHVVLAIIRFDVQQFDGDHKY